MQAKLHIDLTQGVIDIEGDTEFVKSIYYDFKDQLQDWALNQGVSNENDIKDASDSNGAKAKKNGKTSTRKTSKSKSTSKSSKRDNPQLDRSLDLKKLNDYYSQYSPKSHSDKILIFLSFLNEKLGISDPNTDQIYTCYVHLNQKAPNAYIQAFRDAQSKGYIEYNSPEEISIPMFGKNHLHDLAHPEDE